MKKAALLLLVALCAASAGAASLDGTICLMNRSVDRLIIDPGGESGPRRRVMLGAAPVTFRGQPYDRDDLRPGDTVHVITRRAGGHLVARSLEVTMRVDDALVDSIFRSHRTVVGRFAVREAGSELFSLHLPQRRFIRVDARQAYGPNGRVSLGTLKPGDLLEIRGRWKSKDLLDAGSINVITEREPSFCVNRARHGEIDAETTERESEERQFLEKGDN